MMFCEGGHLYVYFTYGMHFCANVVTGREGSGEAVLIRAVEPIAGMDFMIKRRFVKPRRIHNQSLYNLTNGPAKFCEAFGVTKEENGFDLTENDIFIIDGAKIPHQSVGRSKRIGIRVGLRKKWRFFIKDNPWISR